jgi:hypothetical protein
MDPLKVGRLARPPPIAPDDFAGEATRPEDLVTEDFRVVAGLRIHVKNEAALRGQKLPRRNEPVPERGEIGLQAGPPIVEGGLQRAQDPAALVERMFPVVTDFVAAQNHELHLQFFQDKIDGFFNQIQAFLAIQSAGDGYNRYFWILLQDKLFL